MSGACLPKGPLVLLALPPPFARWTGLLAATLEVPVLALLSIYLSIYLSAS